MPLSKARNAARMRNNRALARGVQPSATQLIEVMSQNQRKERLAELITAPIDPNKINPTHIISAIDIYNKMDKVYSDERTPPVSVINSFTFVLPDGVRVTPKQLKEVNDVIEGEGKALQGKTESVTN